MFHLKFKPKLYFTKNFTVIKMNIFLQEIRKVYPSAGKYKQKLENFVNPVKKTTYDSTPGKSDWGRGILIGLPRPLFMLN